MYNELVADHAAAWALSKVGCGYSQSKRTEANYFDCSSLVTRAYSAQGKRWLYGGSVPLSNQEVYDDDFELVWPESYSQIGKIMGGREAISLARNPGDLQFLCTDSSTTRANRITHVTMVADGEMIVQARGKAYGVCVNPIDMYSGRVCAITRYAPRTALKGGMKGYRTLALQKALNEIGGDLKEDGQYGSATAQAVREYQTASGLKATGIADEQTLKHLGLIEKEEAKKTILITGGTVNLRTGPGTEYPSAKIARMDETYEAIEMEGWYPLYLEGRTLWVSSKYAKEVMAV